MNFEELERIIKDEAGITICPICGTPYEPRSGRQRTCAAEECKRLWHNKYLRERRERLITEDKEAFNRYHADAQRKSRHKKKRLEEVDDDLKRAQDYWKRREAQQYLAISDGKEYAERQIADTLAKVPKIDTSGFGKESV